MKVRLSSLARGPGHSLTGMTAAGVISTSDRNA